MQMEDKKMKRVYVCGKLNDMACGYIGNLHNMIINAEKVRKAGFSVFIPGIDFLCGLTTGDWKYEDYFQNSQPWLEAADALFVQGDNWKSSKGTLREIKKAKTLRIPIFYDLDKMKEYFEKIDVEENMQERGSKRLEKIAR
jgi:hypothetical protein